MLKDEKSENDIKETLEKEIPPSKYSNEIFYSIQIGAFGRPRLEYFSNTLNMAEVFEQERICIQVLCWEIFKL